MVLSYTTVSAILNSGSRLQLRIYYYVLDDIHVIVGQKIQ